MIRKSTKQKPPLPKFVVKAQWDATAVYLVVDAINEFEAWNVGWRRIARTEGGDKCLKLTVIREV